MSVATENNVNPYASPSVAVAELVPEYGFRAPSRASNDSLRYISRHAVVANILYPLNAACFVLGTMPTRGQELSQIMMIVCVVTGFLLWFSSIAMAFGSRNFVGGALVALFLPVPFFGSIAFLLVLLSTKDFMCKNGYRPGILGFAVQNEERAQMDSDPMYVPSKFFFLDGAKRPNVFMLGECAFLLGLLLAFGSLFLIQ